MNNCEIYEGIIDKKGYGRIWYDGKSMLAHRAKWIETKGEIPEGKVLIHLCENKACVNLEHLFIASKIAAMEITYELRQERRALQKTVCKKEPD